MLYISTSSFVTTATTTTLRFDTAQTNTYQVIWRRPPLKGGEPRANPRDTDRYRRDAALYGYDLADLRTEGIWRIRLSAAPFPVQADKRDFRVAPLVPHLVRSRGQAARPFRLRPHMPKSKKVKVLIPEEALRDIPEAEREKVRADVLEMFENFDPENPPGTPIRYLQSGEALCQVCQKPLDPGLTTTLPEDFGGETVDYLDCWACDLTYERPAAN